MNLSKSDFNRAQKLIGVANEVGDDMLNYIESLNKRGDYTVDFIPYRFYKIGGELFIEFSPKPFDDNFVARRRHNLICKIVNSLNDKMDDGFCSLHKLSGKYLNINNLNFRKWNGQECFIMSFSREVFYGGARELYLKGFSLDIDVKNFYISFHVWNQDSVVSCSEVAKYIPALNGARFQRMSNSDGNEFFRYDLPISSKYPTVDFVAMDEAARSLFDKKNFDMTIDHMMTEIKQCFKLLNISAATVPPSSTPSDFIAIDEMIMELANEIAWNKLAVKEKILSALSKLKEAAQQNRDAETMNKVADYYEKICEHAKAARCKSVAKNFG